MLIILISLNENITLQLETDNRLAASFLSLHFERLLLLLYQPYHLCSALTAVTHIQVSCKAVRAPNSRLSYCAHIMPTSRVQGVSESIAHYTITHVRSTSANSIRRNSILQMPQYYYAYEYHTRSQSLSANIRCHCTQFICSNEMASNQHCKASKFS